MQNDKADRDGVLPKSGASNTPPNVKERKPGLRPIRVNAIPFNMTREKEDTRTPGLDAPFTLPMTAAKGEERRLDRPRKG